MSNIALELVLILVLLLANGIFAMSELAILSARRTRLEQRAEHEAGAKAALELATMPDNFLSTVQIGITLIGILNGAISGATIANRLDLMIEQIPWLMPYSDTLSVGLVVIVLTFLSIVIGELVPKRLALHNPEGIASAVAPIMRSLAKVAAPAVRLLSAATDLVLRLFSLRPSDEPSVTEADVRTMIEQGTQVGIFEPIEEEIVGQVFRLSDRTVSALFTPRTDIVWLDLNDSPEAIKRRCSKAGIRVILWPKAIWTTSLAWFLRKHCWRRV